MKTILAAILATIFGIVALAIPTHAQTFDAPGGPVCVYRPETITTQHPLRRSVIVQGRAYGYLQPVDAVQYLRVVGGSRDAFFQYEAASAAVQYSIAGSPILGDIRLAAWHDDAPNMTLGGLIRAYSISGNPQQRAFYGMWLVRVVNSAFNDSCNGGTQ